MNHIFVDQKTGELRGRKPGELSYTGLAILGAAAFIGLLLTAIAISPSGSGSVEATRGGGSIPFRSINGGMFIYANLGGVPHNMMVDTGANISSVSMPIAVNLVMHKRATILPGYRSVGTADGAVALHGVIRVHTVTLAGYVLHNVDMVVQPDGATLLLGLPVLNAIGSFTVDQSRHQIRFN